MTKHMNSKVIPLRKKCMPKIKSTKDIINVIALLSRVPAKKSNVFKEMGVHIGMAYETENKLNYTLCKFKGESGIAGIDWLIRFTGEELLVLNIDIPPTLRIKPDDIYKHIGTNFNVRPASFEKILEGEVSMVMEVQEKEIYFSLDSDGLVSQIGVCTLPIVTNTHKIEYDRRVYK